MTEDKMVYGENGINKMVAYTENGIRAKWYWTKCY